MPKEFLVLLVGLSILIGIVALVLIVAGILRHNRHDFRQVTDADELGEKLVPCSYCHTPIPAGSRCPTCGAGE